MATFKRRILFFVPLLVVGGIAALEFLPSGEKLKWKKAAAAIAYSDTPPSILATGYWSRLTDGGKNEKCDGYWTQYMKGKMSNAYGGSPTTTQVQYRIVGDIYEIKSKGRPQSEFLRKEGTQFRVLDEELLETKFLGRSIIQRRCRIGR